MMKAIQITLLVTTLSVSCAEAHHSQAMFDMSKTMTINGTVSEWHFANPHSWLYVAVADAAGVETIWKLEGGSTSHMARSGWTYKSLKKGDKVVVVFNPRNDGEASGAFNSVQLADGNTLSVKPKL
jgi:Family of unknown function (DUF6152)